MEKALNDIEASKYVNISAKYRPQFKVPTNNYQGRFILLQANNGCE